MVIKLIVTIESKPASTSRNAIFNYHTPLALLISQTDFG